MQREFKISLSQEHYSDVVYLSQYDDDYDVIFHVTNKYSAADVGGKSAKFTGTRSDGLGFTFTSTAVGSSVSFHINTSLTACAGTHTAEIVFYDSNDLYFGSANVQVIVEKAAHPEGTIDADEEQLRELAEQVQEIVDNAAAEVKGEAESWAVGERDGEPVPSTDPTYQNNAKFYAEQAAQIAEDISGVTEQVATNTSDISDLNEDLNPIVDLKERITWAKGYWSNGAFIANTSQKRRGTASICHAETDIRVSLGDYSLYQCYINFYTSGGVFISTGGWWLRTDFVIPKDSYYTITLGYVSSSAADSDAIKNAVYDALTMQTDGNYDGVVTITDKLSADTSNLLAITNGTPDPTSNYIYALDLGEDKTFPNGVIFSFDAHDVIVSATNNAVVDLQENDGTHHYCTYASLYDGYGNQFVNTEAQSGRFLTIGFSTYSKSITFRYCIVRLGAITSGSISNFMLTAGQTLNEYADSKTAIDYDARNLIRDDGADYLAQSVYKINGSTIKPVTLLHFSDIHGDTARLTDIMAFANSHDNITDILHTGDTVSGVYSDGLTWWDSVTDSQKILNVIGNHDAITSQTNPTIIDMATIAETFIEPYVSNWGVTYTEGTTYYYKDYDNGVRLICLDCMHITDSTQLSWLQTVLDGALSANKHVVIGIHYYAYPHTVVDCDFSPRVDVVSVQTSIPYTVLDLVKSFQTRGGKFVCYLTGHNHYDIIVTPSDYPEQLVIGVTCATNVYAQSKFGDQTRRGVRFANAFNLVNINPQTNTVSVRRIGADMDMLGRERKGFGWNYANHEKLF